MPLIWGADMLVDGASSLAKKYNVPSIVIGLTVLSFGTSSPEFFINVFASAHHSSFITLGNVIGSNIFNVLLILGISAIIFPLNIKSNTVWMEVPLSLLSALVAVVAANDLFLDNNQMMISRVDGIMMLFFFIIFIVYNIGIFRKGNSEIDYAIKDLSRKKAWIYLILGLALLIAGGQLIVFSAENFSHSIGIPERVVALTLVSLGSSLPELATSIAAAKKKNIDLAVGNIIGSNIFNIFFILGTSALINPVRVAQSSNQDLFFNVFISILVFIFIFTGKGRRIDRKEGAILVAIYVFYFGFIFFKLYY